MLVIIAVLVLIFVLWAGLADCVFSKRHIFKGTTKVRGESAKTINAHQDADKKKLAHKFGTLTNGKQEYK